jgi:hypothetical protein
VITASAWTGRYHPVMTIDQHAGAGTAGPSPEFAKLSGAERTSGGGPEPLAEVSERSAGQLGAAIVSPWNTQPGEPQ